MAARRVTPGKSGWGRVALTALADAHFLLLRKKQSGVESVHFFEAGERLRLCPTGGNRNGIPTCGPLLQVSSPLIERT